MFDFDLSLGAILFSWAAVFVGAIVQRLTGAGYGMIAAPLIALVAPQFLPVALLILGIAVGLSASALNFASVAKADLAPGFLGRTLGAVIAAYIAAQVLSVEGIALTVGLVIWIAILMSLAGWKAKPTPPTLFVAGTAAGIMGTLTAVGAPPMAIVYSQVEARRSAATQNVFFAFGMCVSIAALAFQGLITSSHLWFAALMLPMVPLAFLASRPFVGRIEKGSLRPYALGLSGSAATALILQQLL